MSFTIYDASIPPMIKMLESLSKILDKAVAQAEEQKMDPSWLLQARLAHDMFPLPRQIQIASDAAKGCAARLMGETPPSWPDTETTFAELKDRIAKTVAYLKDVRPDQVVGAEDKEIVIKTPTRELKFSGKDYVNNFVLPNFYFHVTATYALLRMRGIAIGKMDYLGG